MTPDMVAELVPFVIVGTAMLAGLLWLIKAQNAILREFRPNGGHSIKDQLNRVEDDLRAHARRLDHHIDNHK